MRNKRFFFMLVFLGMTKLASATIYQWQDTQGIAHYADDDATKDAKVVVLDPPSIASFPVVSHKIIENKVKAPQEIYTALQIEQPQNQSTIRNAQGNLALRVTALPMLRPSDHLQILVDGKPLKQAVGRSLVLKGIERGAHQLQAKIIGVEGSVLIESKTIIVYLQPSRIKK